VRHGRHVDVGGCEETCQARAVRLEGQDAGVADPRRTLLESLTQRPVAGHDEVRVAFSAHPGKRLHHDVRLLLGVEASCVGEEQAVPRHAEFRTQRFVPARRVERADVDTEGDAACMFDPHGAQPIGHDGGDAHRDVAPAVQCADIPLREGARPVCGAAAAATHEGGLDVRHGQVRHVHAAHDTAVPSPVQHCGPRQVVGAVHLYDVGHFGAQQPQHLVGAEQQPVRRGPGHEGRRDCERRGAPTACHAVVFARHDEHVLHVGAALAPLALGMEHGAHAAAGRCV
jgi:hypothetical protein